MAAMGLLQVPFHSPPVLLLLHPTAPRFARAAGSYLCYLTPSMSPPGFCSPCRKSALHLFYSALPWKSFPSHFWPVPLIFASHHPILLSLKSCVSSWASLRDAGRVCGYLLGWSGLRTCKERQRSGPGGDWVLQSMDQG